MVKIIPDGEIINRDGKTFVSDDGELVEIAETYPNIETALKSLQM